MSKTTAIILVVAIVVISGALFIGLPFRPGVEQPIAFNHRLHIEEVGIECIECHPYFREQKSSGLPDEETCMECHEEPVSDSPEEMKLSSILQNEEGLDFQKLFSLPDHVYYSHRTHIVVAELECENCHGSIAMTTSPPSRPLIKIDMDYCMDCHDKMGVENDCISCHM